MQTDPNMTLGEEPTLLARATANCPAQQAQIVSDDDAFSEGEEIVILDFSSSSGSSISLPQQAVESDASDM
jgi:hypothetical protein